jgi:predicted Holliday junction resolvase-like endonuclease
MDISVQVIKQFAEYGGYIGILTATFILMMTGAIIYLWKYIQKIQGQIELNQKEYQLSLKSFQDDFLNMQQKAQITITDLQNKRVDESKEVRVLLMDFSDENNKVIRGLTEAINAWKEAFIITNKG